MNLEIRTCEAHEQERAFVVCEAAFSESIHPQDTERWSKIVDADRTVVAADGDDLVGTGANFGFEMAVPGGRIPAAGVTMVGVLPSHTRRGILRRIMAELHEDATRRGEPVAILWASESVIYQRFGYGLAVKNYLMDADRSRVTFMNDYPRVGQMRMVDLADAAKICPDTYERVARTTPGMLKRDENWWKHHRLADPEHHRGGRSEIFCGVLEIDGRAEGYALYRSKRRWEPEPTGRVEVLEAIATSPAATADLWRFLFQIDLIEKVRYWWLPLDHPLPHMVREPARLHLTLDDAVWLRLLDVAAALRARGFATAGRVVLDLVDPEYERNRGVWVLDTTGDEVDVARGDEDPDIRLDVNDLAAIYLGGTTMSELLRAGRGSEITAGSAARLDALFATSQKPYCAEIF